MTSLETQPPAYGNDVDAEIDVARVTADYAAAQRTQLQLAGILDQEARRKRCCRRENNNNGNNNKNSCKARVNRFIYLRTALHNVFLALPFALFSAFWVWATFVFAGATALYGGILLLPLFALSWRLLAQLELALIRVTGDDWRVVPHGFPMLPGQQGSFFLRLRGILHDTFTTRATLYFMFVKVPLSYLAYWLTICLPWMAIEMAVGAGYILAHRQEILSESFVFPSHDAPNSFGSAAGSWSTAASTSAVMGSLAASAASASASIFGDKMSGSVADALAIVIDSIRVHQQEVFMCIVKYLASHVVVTVMFFPLALFLIVLSVKAVVALGKLQRTIVINLFGYEAPAVAIPSAEEFIHMPDDEKAPMMMSQL